MLCTHLRGNKSGIFAYQVVCQPARSEGLIARSGLWYHAVSETFQNNPNLESKGYLRKSNMTTYDIFKIRNALLLVCCQGG